MVCEERLDHYVAVPLYRETSICDMLSISHIGVLSTAVSTSHQKMPTKHVTFVFAQVSNNFQKGASALLTRPKSITLHIGNIFAVFTSRIFSPALPYIYSCTLNLSRS